jgi:hypothetical protein
MTCICRLFLTLLKKLLRLYFAFGVPALAGVAAQDRRAAHARQERADRTAEHRVYVDVHGATQAVIYSRPGRRQNVWCVLYST